VPERLAPATRPYVDLVPRWLVADMSAAAAGGGGRRPNRRADAAELVARLRTEIGADHCQVMVPQSHPPASEAEVDFGEFAASIAGQVMKLYTFACGYRIRGRRSTSPMRTKPRNRSWVSMCAASRPSRVPKLIRNDNLKPAAIRIALGRKRFEHPRFAAMQSHYGYDSFFSVPASTARMRRVGWRAKSAGSAALISPRCRRWVRGGVERRPCRR
jgi:hypothetical protein